MKNKTYLYLIISALITIIIGMFPATNGLTKQGTWTLGIFFAALILWTTLGITWPSILILFALGFLPAIGFTNLFIGAFGNSTVAFLLFTFALVYPLSKTSFVRRTTIALITNRIARKGPWHFVILLFCAVTFLGLFMSPTVLMVTFIPFLLDIFRVLNVEKGSKVGNMITMGVTFCANLSSGMTPIAHVWPTLALGFYNSATHKTITQAQYMIIGIPAGILLLALMILMFKFIYHPDGIEKIDFEGATKLKDSVPKADFKEKVILFSMTLTVILWVVPSLLKSVFPAFYTTMNSLTTAFPPMLGCLILFIVQVDGKSIMNFSETVTKGISWPSILMTGVAAELGTALTAKPMGIENFLTNVLSPIAKGLPSILLVLFFVTWCIIETNFSSTIVTITIVSSVVLSVIASMQSGSVSLAALMIVLAIGSAIANMTPAGMAGVNPVAISSEYTTTKDMLVWGAVVAVTAIIILTFIAYPLACLIV